MPGVRHDRWQFRRDSAATWTSTNPVLRDGEIGIEEHDGISDQIKIGNGTDAWNDLDYFSPSAAGSFKNKVIIPSSATLTPPGSAESNELLVTAQNGNALIAAPSGSAQDGAMLTIRITSDASAHTLTWNAIYTAPVPGIPKPTALVALKSTWATFMYNAAPAKWQLIATAQEG